MELQCRNCGSSDVLVVKQGFVAPFFAQRVLGIELSTFGQDLDANLNVTSSRFDRAIGSLARSVIRSLPSGRRVFDHRSAMNTDLLVCRMCSFVGPHHEYTEAELLPLYSDYRSDAYDRDRTYYEPGYAAISHLVGASAKEVELRLANIDGLLARFADVSVIAIAIDWGGGEGRFVPTALRTKQVFVLDVSSEFLCDSRFTRLTQAPADLRADYIQACHLFEHVSSPQRMLAEMLEHASPGAFIYLEVPLDQSVEQIRRFQAADATVRHMIHEHLNLFTVDSVRSLGFSLGLTELDIAEVELDLERSMVTVISGLFRVPGADPLV